MLSTLHCIWLAHLGSPLESSGQQAPQAAASKIPSQIISECLLSLLLLSIFLSVMSSIVFLYAIPALEIYSLPCSFVSGHGGKVPDGVDKGANSIYKRRPKRAVQQHFHFHCGGGSEA